METPHKSGYDIELFVFSLYLSLLFINDVNMIVLCRTIPGEYPQSMKSLILIECQLMSFALRLGI